MANRPIKKAKEALLDEIIPVSPLDPFLKKVFNFNLVISRILGAEFCFF
jgi:hypothetical protein